MITDISHFGARAIKRLRIVALPLALCVGAAGAREARAQALHSLPSPQSLMARHDSLIGGRAIMEQHQSLRMVGTFTLSAAGITAPLEILKVRPNKYLFRTSLGQMGEILSGFDGSTAWAIQPGQGPVILEGEQAAQVALQADFFGDLHDPSKFSGLETLEITEFEGRRAFKTRMSRPDGAVIHGYFDVETGLSAGVSHTMETPMGKMEMVTIYSDYANFGGMLVATRVVQRNPQFDVVLSIVSVEYDVLDPAAVALPESVKALIRP